MTNDHDLDATLDEIAALVSIDPPPEFVPRLRERIAAASMEPRRLGIAWVLVPLTIAASILVAVTVIQAPEPSADRPRTVQQMRPLVQSPAPLISSTAQQPDARPRSTRQAARNEGVDNQQPTALISPAEAEGLALLIASVNQGRLEPAAFESAGIEDRAIAIELATLEPIRVESLQPIPALEGVNP